MWSAVVGGPCCRKVPGAAGEVANSFESVVKSASVGEAPEATVSRVRCPGRYRGAFEEIAAAPVLLRIETEAVVAETLRFAFGEAESIAAAPPRAPAPAVVFLLLLVDFVS